MVYRVTHPPVNCSSDSSGTCWAATVATYSPGRMTELPKPKSTGGFKRPDVSLSSVLILVIVLQWCMLASAGVALDHLVARLEGELRYLIHRYLLVAGLETEH